MKIRIKTAVLLLILILLSSCRQSTSLSSGGTIIGLITNPFTQAGVADVIVYLLSADTEIDTVTFENRHAFVDSAVTDTNGAYTLEDIEPGSYGIFPRSPTMMFKPDTSSDPHIFDIEDDDTYTVNFLLEPPKVQTGVMTITVDVKGSGFRDAEWPLICRQEWGLFVPYWSEWSYLGSSKFLPNDVDPTFCRMVAYEPYGYTAVVVTVTNKFKIKFPNHFIYISFGLSNAPAESYWEYNTDTGELTRL
jgi:hypothetical protein